MAAMRAAVANGESIPETVLGIANIDFVPVEIKEEVPEKLKRLSERKLLVENKILIIFYYYVAITT